MPGKEVKPRKHRHRWQQAWHSSKKTGFTCKVKNCKGRRERDATKSEVRAHKRRMEKEREKCDKMHAVYHDFVREFHAKSKDGQTRYKYDAWTLMSKVGEWAKKYPKDVIVRGCDDMHHASSDLILIKHRVKRRLWGTTVVVITQLDGEPPKEFFLYPSHVYGLATALRELDQHAPMDYINRWLKKKQKKLWR